MYTDARVEDELENCWSAVQEFGFARLSESDVAEPPICELRVPDERSDAPTASDEVATLESAAVPLPYKSCPDENVVCPVPPLPTVSAVASVSAPVESKVLVAVPPK